MGGGGGCSIITSKIVKGFTEYIYWSCYRFKNRSNICRSYLFFVGLCPSSDWQLGDLQLRFRNFRNLAIDDVTLKKGRFFNRRSKKISWRLFTTVARRNPNVQYWEKWEFGLQTEQNVQKPNLFVRTSNAQKAGSFQLFIFIKDIFSLKRPSFLVPRLVSRF